MRAELEATNERIRNIEAALKTWKGFLVRIKSTRDNLEGEMDKVESVFRKINEGIVENLHDDEGDERQMVVRWSTNTEVVDARLKLIEVKTSETIF